MAWPNPFRRRDENTRTCWGYTFQLTPDHLTPEQARPMKHSYDVLGEQCYDILNQMCPQETKSPEGEPLKPEPPQTPGESVPGGEKSSKPKRDLYTLFRDSHEKDPKLQELWDEVTTIPDWVDWDQIARGQDVFYRYGGATLTGLAYQSLLSPRFSYAKHDEVCSCSANMLHRLQYFKSPDGQRVLPWP